MERGNRGFTLIELLTVVAIMGIFVVFLGQLMIFNDRAYQNVDQTSQSQQDLRAISEILERELRHAGMMVPEAMAVCGTDGGGTAPDTLYMSDSAAIDSQNDFSAYAGANVTAASADLLQNTTVILTLDSLILEPSPPSRPAYDTDGNGTADSDFRVGAGVIVGTSLGSDGTACGTITAINLGGNQITVAIANQNGDPDAVSINAVPANVFRIQGTSLLMNGNLLARDVEDLQIAWMTDPDGNNVIDADEIWGNGDTGNNPDYDSESFDHSDLRELRINVVTRTRREDEEFTQGLPQAYENRTATTTQDGYRRRVTTTRIRLRNVGTRMGVST